VEVQNPGQASTSKCTPISRKKITTKQYTPHPYLKKYCHVLATRIAGEPPAFRGKPRFCKKDTVKRRKEIERLFVTMRFANVRE